MRNFFIFLIVLFLKFSIASSQTLQWAKQFGGAQPDAALSNAIDFTGNIYITGYTDTEIFINKVDSNGNTLWSKIIGGPGVDESFHITTDTICNVYICGSFSDSVDFDPGPDTCMLISHGYDAFLLKLDSAGNFIWIRQLGGDKSIDDDHSRSCIVKDNIVYWCGIFTDTLLHLAPNISLPIAVSHGYEDVFVLKMDSSGNILWSKTIGGIQREEIAAIAIDNTNNLLLTGMFNGLCDFNPDTTVNFNLTSFGQFDVYVCKFDSAGNFIWAKQFGGAQHGNGTDILSDQLGNVIISGYFSGIMDVDPGSTVFNLSSHGNRDVFLVKLDANGQLIWAKNLGGTGTDMGMKLSLDSSANIYTTGRFADTVDFDPGVGVYNLFGNSSGDTFVSKIDSAGNFVWANQLTGTTDNVGTSIALDKNQNIYVAGGFHGYCDFDPSNNSFNLISSGIDDAYIFKWSQPITGLHDNYTNTLIKVFPNPFAENVQINVIEKATVTISTITGQVILRTILAAGINTITLASQQSGTYLLNVLTDKSSSNAIIVKSN